MEGHTPIGHKIISFFFFFNLQFSSVSFSNPALIRDEDETLLMYGGIIQIFNVEETAVPILPYEAWICTLYQMSFCKPVNDLRGC